MIHIQDWVHRISESNGLRFLKPPLMLLVLAGLMLVYNFRGFKNMANAEAMDAAQVARNLAEHKGFSTLFVRPFSLYLVQRANAEKLGPAPVGDVSDRAQIRGLHPDLANAPLYPVLLAGLMKVAPHDYRIRAGKSIWNRGGEFWVYPPDFFISLLNQLIFAATVLLLFLLARKLFDSAVAWTSTVLFLGTDLFWRFSVSGLSTMLVMLVFVLLAWCLVGFDQAIRGGAPFRRSLLFAALCGLVLGVGGLTRYSFLFLLLPVLFFVAVFAGPRRAIYCLVVLAVCATTIAPWLARNYQVSHTLFGTAGYAAIETTPQFTEFRLERSLKPVLTRWDGYQVWFKTANNARLVLQDDLPKLGGNWVIGFFFAGFMVLFKDPARNRLRWFLLACFPVLVAAQAMGKTQLSEASPVINSENLLILLMPLIIMFGVAIFYVLLEQMDLPHPGIRGILIGAFCLVTCLPMVLTFFSARTMAVAYPPYYPPTIQGISNWMHEDELMMSDIPWAVAWYGKRQCIWTTLNAQEDFFAVYDYLKPVRALYLTPETMDSKFLSQWVRASEHSWGSFILETVNKQQIPANFPLRSAPTGFLPEQFFLTDRERWKK